MQSPLIKKQEKIGKILNSLTRFFGSKLAFLLAVGLVVAWTFAGFLHGFDDFWLLIINTLTTIVTFIMVFAIQYSQNKSDVALHLKIDEVLRAIDKANNKLINIEDLDGDEIETLKIKFMSKYNE